MIKRFESHFSRLWIIWTGGENENIVKVSILPTVCCVSGVFEVRRFESRVYEGYIRGCRKSPNLPFVWTLHIVKSNSYKTQNEGFRVFRQSLQKR